MNNYQQSQQYAPQGSSHPYQQNQMSNYQQQYGQNPMFNPQQGQMPQPSYGQPSYAQQYNQQQQSEIPQPSFCPPQQGNMPPQTYGDNPNQTDIPNFKLYGRGKGIDDKEYYVITHASNDAFRAKEDPLSNGIIKRIKRDLGGEWMVFASVEGLKGYDFSLSIVTGNDFLSFTIENFRFQVCRLRD